MISLLRTFIEGLPLHLPRYAILTIVYSILHAKHKLSIPMIDHLKPPLYWRLDHIETIISARKDFWLVPSSIAYKPSRHDVVYNCILHDPPQVELLSPAHGILQSETLAAGGTTPSR